MRHHFLDQYRDHAGPLHRLDPRAKLLGTLALVAAVVLTPNGDWRSFALFLGVELALLLLAAVPPAYVLRRTLTVLPFVLVVAVFLPFAREGAAALAFRLGPWHVTLSREGLVLLGSVLAKACLSAFALILLTATTHMRELLLGLRRLHAPQLFVALFAFMYRYLFVLTDEAERLATARSSRALSRDLGLGIRSVGHMAGSLFIRSYERGERIYGAMLARGGGGESRTLTPLRFGPADLLFTLTVAGAAGAISLLRYL